MVVVRCEDGTEATKALGLAMLDLLSSLVKRQPYYYEAKIPTNVKAKFSLSIPWFPRAGEVQGGLCLHLYRRWRS